MMLNNRTMPNIERVAVERLREDCSERRPGQTEPIIVQLRESKEGTFKAEFRLALSGIANTPIERKPEGHHDAGPWIVDNIRALFTNLSEGQALDFGYSWRHDSDEIFRFSWEVSGACKGISGEDALERAKDLLDSLQVTLGGPAYGVRFSPDRMHELHGAGRARTYVVEPTAIAIPASKGRRIGYEADQPINQKVILSLPSNGKSVDFNSVVRTGRASPFSFTVLVHVRGFTINDSTLAVLAAAFENLRSGEVGQIQIKGSKSGRIYDEALVASTMQSLERWLGDPRGYKVSCSIHADGPLPKSLSEVIGRELFGGVPILVREIGDTVNVEEPEHTYIVDLAGCYHRMDNTVSLLPSNEILRDVGVPRFYTAAPATLAGDGLILGYCRERDARRMVRLPESDRSRHCYVIGATGTGKSTLLYNMISQDIQGGQGLCMIDPHGDLYEKVLNSIPEHRAKDVILMDLADFRYSVGINFLECGGASKDIQMNFIVNELITIFSRLYNMDIAGGPVFESYMRNALLAIMGNEHRTATLLDVVRFFEDARFRMYTKGKSKNALAVSFWERQAEKVQGDGHFSNMGPYITSKLNQFTHNALLRPIIGQPKSTINFQKAMNNGQIILVNLAKGLLGEFDVRLLGMLLIGKFFNAALGRASMRQTARRPFYLYIDEFQNLATPTIIGLLSEARKFGLSLVMANQHLGQFSEEDKNRGVADAILGNVATMLLFRMGPKDAEKLETYTKPYLDSQDLQHLPDRHVACRMLNNNVPVPSFVFETLPTQTPHVEEEQKRITRNIRRRTRRVHTRQREKVEEWIMRGWSKGEDSD